MSEAITLKRSSPASKIGYGFGAAACGLGQIIPAFLTYYMTESLVVPIIMVSTMVVAIKVLDAFTDIIFGIILDKTKSAKGKARPWFLWAAIPYGVCFALIFSVPQSLSVPAKVAMVAIFYALTVSIFGTALNVARYALLPRMSMHPADRATYSVVGDGVLCCVVGGLMSIVLVVTAMFGWTATFIVLAIIGVVCLLICYALCKELPREEFERMEGDAKAKVASTKDLLRSLFTNKYALFILLYVLLQGIVAGICQMGGTYFFTYIVGSIPAFSIAMIISIVGGVVAMVIAKFVMNKSSRVFGYSMFFSAALMLIAFFVAGPNTVMLTAVIVGTSLVFTQVTAMITFGQMSAMAIDYGEWKSGTRADGATASVVNIGTKVGIAVGTAIIGAQMAAGGFVEGGVEQTAEALSAIRNAYLVTPVIVAAIAGVFFFISWRLHKQMPKIMEDLSKRRGN